MSIWNYLILNITGKIRNIFENDTYYVSTILDRLSQWNENLSDIVETLFVLFRFIMICSVYMNQKSYSKINIRI